MNDIIIELYKYLGDEIDTNKKYNILCEKLKMHKKDELVSMLKSIIEHRKSNIQNITKLIKETLKVEYKDNKELQDLVNNLNDIMIKTFI